MSDTASRHHGSNSDAGNPGLDMDLDFSFSAFPAPQPIRPTTRPGPAESTGKAPAKSPDKNETGKAGEHIYQVPYEPASRLPATGALIPSSMVASAKFALRAFQDKHGSVDEYVCQALQIGPDDLERILSAEQVDATALSLQAMIDGREPILADVTGFGKGRTLAAVAKAIMLRGDNVVFCTEASHLFSDFWRDIRDVHAEKVVGDPIIMNAGPGRNSDIVDMNRRQENGKPIVFHRHSPEILRALERDGWPKDGPTMLMTTYSQFNRKDSPKIEMATNLAAKAYFIFDESHNTVTRSHIGNNIRTFKIRSLGRINGSATYGRGIEEMTTYSGAMPWLVVMEGVGGFKPANLAPGIRTALEEASATKASRLGTLIRREHDMRDIVMAGVDVMDHLDAKQVHDTEDRFSHVARTLSQIWRASAKACRDLDTNEFRNARPSNFGTTFAALNRNFSLALMLPVAVQQAKAKALQGKRYVGVIDATQEQTLDILRETRENPDSMPGLEVSDSPDLRDLIMISALRLRNIAYKGEGNAASVLVVSNGDIEAQLAILRETLRDFPPLPISPLDYLKRGIEQEGDSLFAQGKIDRPWRVGEISGRTLGLDEQGGIVGYSPPARSDVIYGFNNGGENEYTHLLLTRAAAVGLSIHDNVANAISMQRHMQEILPTANVIERVQMWGRIGRRGSRTAPEYSMLSSSMSGDLYTVVNQGKKISRISAVVSGSSETLRMLQGMSDPIDRAGEMAASGFLAANPRVRQTLMVGTDEESESSDGVEANGREFPLINAILRRIRLLPFERQRHVFDMLMERRDEILTAFPHEPGFIEGVWEEVDSVILDPGFERGQPLKCCRFESERVRLPINSERLRTILKTTYPTLVKPDTLRQQVIEHAKPHLEEIAKRTGFKSAAEAVNATGRFSYNDAQEEWKKIRKMANFVGLLPGRMIVVPDNGETTNAILVAVRYRGKGIDPLLARAYKVEYVRPGDDAIQSMSLEWILKAPGCGVGEEETEKGSMARKFDAAVTNSMRLEKIILTGDPIDEVTAAIRLGGGTRTTFRVRSRAGIEWHHGVVVPKSLHKAVSKIPMRVVSPDMALDAIEAGYPVTSKMRDDATSGFRIYQIKSPRAKGIYIDVSELDTGTLKNVASIMDMDLARSAGVERFNSRDAAKEGIESLLAVGAPMFVDHGYRQIADLSDDDKEQDTSSEVQAAAPTIM